MKTWKFERDNNRLIIFMIDKVKKHQGIDLNVDDVNELYSKNKKQLIEILVQCVKDAGNPQLDFLEVYY